MITTAEEFKRTHPDYDKHAAEWRFLHHSYVGGPTYQKAQYLTRYLFESEEDYYGRLDSTPYDNHCKTIVHLYNSFIYANPPIRDVGSWNNNPVFEDFLEDADMEGRSLNQFMRQVDITASTFGHAWIIMDKSSEPAETLQQQSELGIRPYLSLYNPMNVMDWQFSRQPNGKVELVYLKIVEEPTGDRHRIRVFTKESIEVYEMSDDRVRLIYAMENPIGSVPAVCCYNARSGIPGIGLGELGDIARLNRTIYDHTSEMIEIIRLANHPSLVKTQSVQAGAGPGAIIQMEENMDPGLRPYLLQPDSASLDGVRGTISDLVRSINTIAAVGSVRATEARTMSGVALETENRILNAKLSEKADNLELCEEQLMELWAKWQNTEWTGTIDYPDSFNARDRANDLEILIKSNDISTNPRLREEIQRQLAGLLVSDPHELGQIVDETAVTELTHEPVTDATLESHMRSMLSEGYTEDQIKQLHPELLDVMLRGYIDMINNRNE